MTGDTWAVQIQMSVSGDTLFAHATLSDGLAPLTGIARVPLHGKEPSASDCARAARRALTELAGSLRRLEVPAVARGRVTTCPGLSVALLNPEQSAIGA